ncbi:hypothetical protein [Nesterenkonia rhizosphaerae]|uniref:NADH:ubiquinone oxidoreductase intermediate-associated protein 30 domain-containing protein n=1 Tax=Nesterenkonia rhizosphaerae TaxID=1348272 RepID=A0ABP9G140_9MICC
MTACLTVVTLPVITTEASWNAEAQAGSVFKTWSITPDSFLTDFTCEDPDSFGSICHWVDGGGGADPGARGQSFDVVPADTPSGKALHVRGPLRIARPLVLNPSELQAGDVIVATMRVRGTVGDGNGANFRLAAGKLHSSPRYDYLDILRREYSEWTDVTLRFRVPSDFGRETWMRLAFGEPANVTHDLYIDSITASIIRR